MNIMKLRNTLNESVEYSKLTSARINPHSFCGELNESHFHEMNILISESAFDISRTANSLSLAVKSLSLNESANVDVLYESALGTVINKIQEFFKAVIGFIKGIIEKIGNYLATMSKNVDTWLTKVAPQVEARKSKASEFEYEGYIWNVGMISTLYQKSIQIYNMGKLKAIASVLKEDMEYAKGKIEKNSDASKQENWVDEVITEHSRKVGLSGVTDMKEFEEKRLSDLKEKMSNILDKQEITGYQEYYKEKIKGKETKTISGFKNISIDNMIKYIRDSSSTIKRIQEQYKGLEADLSGAYDIISNLPKLENSISNPDSEEKKGVSGKISDLNKIFSIEMDCIRDTVNVINGLRNIAINCTQEYTKEFMGILSKFVRDIKK